MRDLQAILRGGYCTRWHANADMAHIRETLAEHHARVAQIILALHPAPSLALIDAALHHDCGEPAVGDVPWPVKRDNPALKDILDEIEARERDRIGVPEATGDDVRWLKFADRLAGWMHVKHTNPAALNCDDWRNDGWALAKMAEDLGIWSPVAKIMGVI